VPTQNIRLKTRNTFFEIKSKFNVPIRIDKNRIGRKYLLMFFAFTITQQSKIHRTLKREKSKFMAFLKANIASWKGMPYRYPT
jgi:hypothetical protein